MHSGSREPLSWHKVLIQSSKIPSQLGDIGTESCSSSVLVLPRGTASSCGNVMQMHKLALTMQSDMFILA